MMCDHCNHRPAAVRIASQTLNTRNYYCKVCYQDILDDYHKYQKTLPKEIEVTNL